MLDSVQSLNVIFDVYQKGSCKREIKEGRNRNDGARLFVKENTPI